jgi:hypothetical protein
MSGSGLSGATLVEFNLREASIIYADFPNVTFADSAEFQETTFIGHTSFHKATFTRAPGSAGRPSPAPPTSFGHIQFRGRLRRGDVHRRRRTGRIRRGTFAGPADFIRASFTRFAWFKEAAFAGPTWFREATFGGAGNFIPATFASDASTPEAQVRSTDRYFTVTVRQSLRSSVPSLPTALNTTSNRTPDTNGAPRCTSKWAAPAPPAEVVRSPRGNQPVAIVQIPSGLRSTARATAKVTLGAAPMMLTSIWTANVPWSSEVGATRT